MDVDYVPLLQVQRDLHDIPRNAWDKGKPKRFAQYLRILTSKDGLELPPLGIINPMAKDHLRIALDDLLALDADGIAAEALTEANRILRDVPGRFNVAPVVLDDQGGWTNRWVYEYDHRFPALLPTKLPRWTNHLWLTALLWAGDPASVRGVREAILTMAHRLAYVQRQGPARTLCNMLAQEGYVMASAGCDRLALDADDITYTREVVMPYLDVDDKRTCLECLFGDEAAGSLGFTPHGLSPWAGLALALHDAKATMRQQASFVG